MNTETLLEPPTQTLDDRAIIHLPFGLLGFEQVKSYILLAAPNEKPFMWMQMMDAPRKSFLIVSPFLVMPEYQLDIPERDVEFLDLTEPTDALVFNICTLRGPGNATINLKPPLVINRYTLICKQVIHDNASQYALNHPLLVT